MTYTLNEYKLALETTAAELLAHVGDQLPGVTVEMFVDGALDGAHKKLEAVIEGGGSDDDFPVLKMITKRCRKIDFRLFDKPFVEVVDEDHREALEMEEKCERAAQEEARALLETDLDGYTGAFAVPHEVVSIKG